MNNIQKLCHLRIEDRFLFGTQNYGNIGITRGIFTEQNQAVPGRAGRPGFTADNGNLLRGLVIAVQILVCRFQGHGFGIPVFIHIYRFIACHMNYFVNQIFF